MTLSDVLHTAEDNCVKLGGWTNGWHYTRAKLLPGGIEAERAFLCFTIFPFWRWRMSRILRAEIKLRDKARRAMRELQAAHIATGDDQTGLTAQIIEVANK